MSQRCTFAGQASILSLLKNSDLRMVRNNWGESWLDRSDSLSLLKFADWKGSHGRMAGSAGLRASQQSLSQRAGAKTVCGIGRSDYETRNSLIEIGND